MCAVGYSRLVYYDYKEGKKTPIPQELRDRINPLQGTNFERRWPVLGKC